MTKKFDLLIYIGRFQPPHKAHIRTIEQALELSEWVIVFLGSANEPPSLKNPWSTTERARMILRSVKDHQRLFINEVKDIPEDNNAWALQIKEKANDFGLTNIGLVGHYKDTSSFYLDLFPEWELVEMENTCGTNATEIREEYFNLPNIDLSWADNLPIPVIEYLREFKGTEGFLEVFNQIHYNKAHYT